MDDRALLLQYEAIHVQLCAWIDTHTLDMNSFHEKWEECVLTWLEHMFLKRMRIDVNRKTQTGNSKKEKNICTQKDREGTCKSTKSEGKRGT